MLHIFYLIQVTAGAVLVTSVRSSVFQFISVKASCD